MGKDNIKQGKGRGNWPLGIGAAGEKRKMDRERERGRETGRQRSRGGNREKEREVRWAGHF